MALIGGFAKVLSDKNRLRYQMRFTIKVAILAVLIALGLQPGYARLLPQDDSVRAAFELLLEAEDVKSSSFGITGARPKEYDAFEILWNAGKAAEDYALKLVLDGTPAARVYGAILLLKLDEAAARREFPKLTQDKTTVRVFPGGCVGRHETVGNLVRKLENGELIISTPKGVRRK
jgi:hypothetical protein